MTIFQEQSSVKTDVTAGTSNAGPATTKRSIETTVVVDDGQIIVLGGLIEDRFITNQSKVPLLGDLPLVGGLFRSENRTRKKTNLMVFLRPVVMRDAAAPPSADARPLRRDPRPAEGSPAAQSMVMPINEAPVMPRRERPARPARPSRAIDAARPLHLVRRRRPPRRCRADERWAERPPPPALRLRQGEHAAARGRRRAARAVGRRDHAAGGAVRGAAPVRRRRASSTSRPPRWRSASPRPTPAARAAPPR